MSELAMLNEQDTRMKYLERTDRSVFQLRAQSALLGIPDLRAAWSMAIVDYIRPECTDLSGHGNHLQSAVALGNVTFGRDLLTPFSAPLASFGGGANQYLTKADGGANNWADIRGIEVNIIGSQRGLTLGGWFWWAGLPGAQQYLMAKDDGGANRQYRLEIGGFVVNTPDLTVWPGPVSMNTGIAINIGWNHIIGIYDQPSQTLFMVQNDVVVSGAPGAAPAALADTAAPFTIGADGAGAVRFAGRASMCLLSAASVTQTMIRGLRQEQRNVFGV